jgi:hypothetical protein
MTGILEQSGIIGVMGTIDDLLGVVGLSNPFYDLVREVDFDPDPSVTLTDAIGGALTGVGAGVESGVTNVPWLGPSADAGASNEECLVTLTEVLLDLGILFIEVVVEFLDIVIELLNIAMSLLIAFIAIVSVIVAVATAAAFFTAGTSFGAAAAAIAQTLLAFLGSWSVVAAGLVAIGQFITHFIDQFIEGLQDDLYAARSAGCIDGGRLNSWDPDGPDIPGILNW